MLDTAGLRRACDALLDAADTVADTEAPATVPAGEWNADQILAHVCLVNAATIATACSVAAGNLATYDNRIASDPWTIGHVMELAGGTTGLRDRIRRQRDMLCALDGFALSDTELDTAIPSRLLSGGVVLVDQPLSLRDILTGLGEVELPGHAAQLLGLLPRQPERSAQPVGGARGRTPDRQH